MRLIPDEVPTETVRLRTVGIDIGSSTTHLMFARLVLERDGVRLSSRYQVVERSVTYESDIHLTPYSDPDTIDVERVGGYLRSDYAAAGITPAEIDTGAVIITGEAALKHNASRIIELFAEDAGRFVCAIAGPHLEGSLAAHGSGAVTVSAGRTILNVDVGGGTTKLSVITDGRVSDSAAVSVGARLVAWDDDGRVTRVERSLGRYVNPLPRLGDEVAALPLREIAGRMADDLVVLIRSLVVGEVIPERLDAIHVTTPLSACRPIEAITFSGGVSEYMSRDVPRRSDDLGPQLADELWTRAQETGVGVERAAKGIRATIIGASQYTVQVSGNTISVSAHDVLPLRNVPVIPVEFTRRPWRVQEWHRQIVAGLERAGLQDGRDLFALGIRWSEDVDHSSLSRFCVGVTSALPWTIRQRERPLILVIDEDVAGLVGATLREEHDVSCPVVALDQIDLEEWSYIDIGAVQEDRNVVPVVVKSLVFK